MKFKTAKKEAIKGYPEQYFDFSDGGVVHKDTLKRWIDEYLIKVKKELKTQTDFTTYIASGRHMVIVKGYKQFNEEGIEKMAFEVFVVDSYKSYDLDDIDVKVASCKPKKKKL